MLPLDLFKVEQTVLGNIGINQSKAFGDREVSILDLPILIDNMSVQPHTIWFTRNGGIRYTSI